ncbi:MAG: pdhA [Parachlamydiales bacterium]|nr:pdhA [Parachlamydiales bacterium]
MDHRSRAWENQPPTRLEMMAIGRDKSFFTFDLQKVIDELGCDALLAHLQKMLLIRNLEIRGEAAYQNGKVGGFYHSYIGQEAIQTGCVAAAGDQHWYTTTYRCHALALLLGATPNEIMAELFGKETGNAKGRGGSMHLFTDRLLGGLAIVGGQVPIATGAAFSIKYQKQKGMASFCFLGEGAVAQGAFHESLNLASLWNLPAIYVIENNHWGMGTAANRAIAVDPIADHLSKSYDMRSIRVDGMDFFACYAAFKEALAVVLKTSRPILIEADTQRFRGHSISDPGQYRSKEELRWAMERDPIALMKTVLILHNMLTEEEFRKMDLEQRDKVLAAVSFAEASPWPSTVSLEEGVMAP